VVTCVAETAVAVAIGTRLASFDGKVARLITVYVVLPSSTGRPSIRMQPPPPPSMTARHSAAALEGSDVDSFARFAAGRSFGASASRSLILRTRARFFGARASPTLMSESIATIISAFITFGRPSTCTICRPSKTFRPGASARSTSGAKPIKTTHSEMLRMYMACSKTVVVARCASEKPLVFSSTCLYQSSSPSLPSENSSRDLMTPSSPVPAGYMPRMPLAPPFLRYLPFSCMRLTSFFPAIVTSIARMEHCAVEAFLFCLPQTTFHTEDGRRRQFPQKLDSRAEDNNPTSPTAPTSPSWRTKEPQNHKIRQEPFHK
jgi:hypothetical protein